MKTFQQIGADRLAYECAKLIQSGKLDSRSLVGDALLDYMEIGHPDKPQDVPTWMDNFDKYDLNLQPENTTNEKSKIKAERQKLQNRIQWMQQIKERTELQLRNLCKSCKHDGFITLKLSTSASGNACNVCDLCGTEV
jgi:hypothetical protein